MAAGKQLSCHTSIGTARLGVKVEGAIAVPMVVDAMLMCVASLLDFQESSLQFNDCNLFLSSGIARLQAFAIHYY